MVWHAVATKLGKQCFLIRCKKPLWDNQYKTNVNTAIHEFWRCGCTIPYEFSRYVVPEPTLVAHTPPAPAETQSLKSLAPVTSVHGGVKTPSTASIWKPSVGQRKKKMISTYWTNPIFALSCIQNTRPKSDPGSSTMRSKESCIHWLTYRKAYTISYIPCLRVALSEVAWDREGDTEALEGDFSSATLKQGMWRFYHPIFYLANVS